MNFSRISINFDETRHLDLGDLESISSGVSSKGSISLHASVRNFMELSDAARDAAHSPDMAEKHYVNLCLALRTHLENDGFDADVLACRGLQTQITPCSDILRQAIHEHGQEAVRKDFTHLAVRVGNIIIDPAHLRCGTHYMSSNNALYAQFKNLWADIRVMGQAKRVDTRTFGNIVARIVSMTSLYTRTQPALASTAFDPATASSLVDGFGEGGRFQRNRRLRGATA